MVQTESAVRAKTLSKSILDKFRYQQKRQCDWSRVN
jgi:hypothetical protein